MKKILFLALIMPGLKAVAQMRHFTCKMQSVQNNRILDADDAGGRNRYNNGTRIHLNDPNGGSNQEWDFTEIYDNVFEITCHANNKALTAQREMLNQDGTEMMLWDKTGGNNQQWKLTQVSPDAFYIACVANNRVIDMNRQDGSIMLWSFDPGQNHQWRLLVDPSQREYFATRDHHERPYGENADHRDEGPGRPAGVEQNGFERHEQFGRDGRGEMGNEMPERHELKTGQFLRTGEFLTSRNHQYFMILQQDGNMCIFRGANPMQRGERIWQSGHTAEGHDFFLIMQDDGNFVAYKGTGPNDNRGPYWAGECNSGGGHFCAVLQDDGTLNVNHGEDPFHSGGVTWSSR